MDKVFSHVLCAQPVACLVTAPASEYRAGLDMCLWSVLESWSWFGVSAATGTRQGRWAFSDGELSQSAVPCSHPACHTPKTQRHIGRQFFRGGNSMMSTRMAFVSNAVLQSALAHLRSAHDGFTYSTMEAPGHDLGLVNGKIPCASLRCTCCLQLRGVRGTAYHLGQSGRLCRDKGTSARLSKGLVKKNHE